MSGSLGGLVSVLLGSTPRSIGMIIPDVVIEEEARDDLRITDNPVEQGASITDHAFKLPAEITMRCGWSNAGQFEFDENYVKQVYANLLNLQASRQPFPVTTGKRYYPTMLMPRLALVNNASTEYSLFVSCTLREVFLVSVTLTSVPPASQQAMPQQTAATADPGQQQATPAPQVSLLRRGGNALGLTTAGAPGL